MSLLDVDKTIKKINLKCVIEDKLSSYCRDVNFLNIHLNHGYKVELCTVRTAESVFKNKDISKFCFRIVINCARHRIMFYVMPIPKSSQESRFTNWYMMIPDDKRKSSSEECENNHNFLTIKFLLENY